jgi:hypothetical protein
MSGEAFLAMASHALFWSVVVVLVKGGRRRGFVAASRETRK